MSDPVVGVIMGSGSDLPVMEKAGEILKKLGIPHEMRVISAHRTPREAAEYATSAAERGLRVLIAGAGGSAALAGTLAAHTNLPVIGIPVNATSVGGVDALYSCAQMPPGFPVATVAIGEWGAINAALLAARILALGDEALAARLAEYREGLAEKTRQADREVRGQHGNA